ncbi:MAG: hypothetical protein IPH28_17770 [Cytophagaceae bacterium]|nr:hypothetical protein [Cytophagaceae bacterium]
MKKIPLLFLVLLSINALAGRPIMDSLAKEVKKVTKMPASFSRDTLLLTSMWRYSYYSIYFHEKHSKSRLDSLEILSKKTKWKTGEGMFLMNKSYYIAYFENDFSRGLTYALRAKDLLEKTRNYEALAMAKVRIASTMLWNIQNIAVSKNEFLKRHGYFQGNIRLGSKGQK